MTTMTYQIGKTDNFATFALASRTLRFDCNAKDTENSQRTQKRSFMPGLKGKYDAWNRLIEVRNTSDSLLATYSYNGLNQRIKKIVGSETRLFYFNQDWQCLEERVGSTVAQTYTWGLRYIDDLICRDKSTERLYSLADPNWNVVALSNTSGTVQERMAYSAFGKEVWLNASFVSKASSGYVWNRTFTGQVLDETSLMLYRNRYYHTGLGRFVQRDPIGYGGRDTSLYRYVFNQPRGRTDARGTDIIVGHERPNPFPTGPHIPPYGTDIIPMPDITIPQIPEGPLFPPIWNEPPIFEGPIPPYLQYSVSKKGKCGADITQTLKNFEQKVLEKTNKVRIEYPDRFESACDDFINSNALGSWDIDELYLAGGGQGRAQGDKDTFAYVDKSTGVRWGYRPCAGTVTVNGKCYWAAEVNYYLYGILRSLCTGTAVMGAGDKIRIAAYRNCWYCLRLLEDSDSIQDRRGPGTGVPGRIAWAEAGWSRNMNDIHGHVERCEPSKHPYDKSLKGHFGCGSIKF